MLIELKTFHISYSDISPPLSLSRSLRKRVALGNSDNIEHKTPEEHGSTFHRTTPE
jgi:hypothetical protein